MIGALIALFFFIGDFGIMALPVFVVSFSFIQLICLLLGFGNKAKKLLKISIFLHPGIKELLRLSLPRFFAFTLLDINLMVDRFFASLLGAGYISALTYGGRIAISASGLIIAPFIISMFPNVSNYAAHNEKDAILIAVLKGIRIFAFILIPWGVLLIIFRDEIIKAIFQHGAFSHMATSFTAEALLFYSFGVLCYGLNPLLKMVFFVFKDNLELLKVSLIGLFTNLILDFILIKFLGHGGLALSTSLVSVITASYLFVLLRHKLGGPLAKAVFNEMTKPIMATAFTFIILKLIHSEFIQNRGFDGLLSLGLLLAIGVTIYVCFFSIIKRKLKVG
jgi:putative peptidoglycan lipid II flippase